MIWATVSSQSCFCWLYRASPSLTVKNIISLISVLTIWWCPCVESSLVLLEEGFAMTSAFSGKTLSAFSLLHSVFQGQICLLLQVFLDFLLLQCMIGVGLVLCKCSPSEDKPSFPNYRSSFQALHSTVYSNVILLGNPSLLPDWKWLQMALPMLILSILFVSGSSTDKESACSAGDPGSIPGSGRSPGEGRRDRLSTPVFLGFPCGSAGKESACNVGDLGLIPGLGRSPEKGKATHSNILAWRIPWTYSPWGHKESDTTEWLSLSADTHWTPSPCQAPGI